MKHFGLTGKALFVLVATAIACAACGSSSGPSATPKITTPTSTAPTAPVTSPSETSPTQTSAPATSTALAPPPVPVTGAYLGAYVDPGTAGGTKGTAAETSVLPVFNQQIGKSVGIVHVYTPWREAAPIAEVSAISANGGIAMLDWGCGDADTSVAAGADDSTITAFAQALKTYGKPVFLRWFWEMNFLAGQAKNPDSPTNVRLNTCISSGGAAGYVAAWQHIWNVFQQVGATNVAFVWCPGLDGAAAPSMFYPGNQYVNWIAVDAYDRNHSGASAFSSLFSSFYQQWSPNGKPIMIGETGATSVDQVAYLQGMLAAMPSFPDIKAVVYFDAVGPAGNWTLAGAGLTEFSDLLNSPTFQPTF
jgi:hypothetical protein